MTDPCNSMISRWSLACILYCGHLQASPVPAPFDLQVAPDQTATVRWESINNRFYDLWSSTNLTDWAPVDGFPKSGTGAWMNENFEVKDRHFFRMASAPGLASYLYPEVVSYQASTGISLEAANEINQFLRNLRGSGVEPALFWVGGSRYNSITGSTARAVIGGNGTVSGVLGARGERHETFGGNQSIQFANPLKNGSQSRVGFFAGASPAIETGGMGLISGGAGNPIGPRLGANWGSGDFRVFNSAGSMLVHSGFGGYAKAGSFLPYVGAAYDGYYSVLCGLGKSNGSRQYPLRYAAMPPEQFPNNQFVNHQDFIQLGAPGFSGKLHFAMVTAADLTDNRTAYDIISIPRRSGFGAYGTQTAAVFLGDSITFAYHHHVWNSEGASPPHKGGGQWNRNSLGLLANATGENTAAQIEYFEKAGRYALDPRTWDHVFYVCGSGGHYPTSEHVTQNPLLPATRLAIDEWVNEYHRRIAVPASELGASVVQMIYIYGCPQKGTGNSPESSRAFTDYFTQRQRAVALAAGFTIFDAYNIPQLHAPLEAFYNDVIHPNTAGNRLLAQEFAASVANPSSRIPRSLSRPAITGATTVGSLLSSTRGSWAFTPTTYTYQWMRDATDIPGASAATYRVSASDSGFHISCRVTATNIHGSAERTSAHTAMVVP